MMTYHTLFSRSEFAMASRRDFLKSTAAATFASTSALALAPAVRPGGSDTLKVGLIGCGGRGRGAASDILNADPNTQLVAICDLFPDIVKNVATEMIAKNNPRISIENRIYSGFDGYKELIDKAGCDVVLLGTPPGFRPAQLEYAVRAGKHVFAEKPMAVDAVGVRSVIASAKLAKEKNLLCASGFCFRHDPAKVETVKRIQDGAIGDVMAMHITYNTSYVWAPKLVKEDWSEMEAHVRNWYYYTWLSGDHLVEQHCHNIDKACWVMGEMPIAATGLGGRQVRVDSKFGNIWDHFSMVFEYKNGRKVFANCRQMPNCKNQVSDHVFASKGQAQLMDHSITADGKTWQYETQKSDRGMYVQEHVDFVQSIRDGKPFNDMESAANSTLMAILGREASYTGQRITWKQIEESQQNLVPETLTWGVNPVPAVAMPGVTKFV
jgi:myo-inositol 2-dehydrogenase / D-chiro-inositol 1-dehydrogenase